MPTTKTLFPAAYQTLEDINGAAVTGGTVTFLDTGTAVLATVYADANGLVVSPNPLTVDAAGRYSVWLTPGQVVDVEYRDDLGTLLTTVPGVMGAAGASGNVDVFGVMGEGPFPPGKLLFLSTGAAGEAGKWHGADADFTDPQMPTIGFATVNSPDEATVPIRIAGRIEGLSGLLVGQVYYTSNTPGELSLVPGTNGRLVGQADSTTSLVLWPNPPPLDSPTLAPYTGTGVVVQLVPTARTMILMGGAPLTVQGIRAGYHGQRLRLQMGGSGGETAFENSSAAAAPADRLYNFANFGATRLATGSPSGRGLVDYEYDATVPGWRLTAHEQGSWITPPFNAADYVGSNAMTWTVAPGSVARCAYYLRGTQLAVQLTIVNSTIGGTPSSLLQRVVPGGYTPNLNTLLAPVMALENGAGVLSAGVSINGPNLAFRHDITGGSNWALGTAWLGADFQIEVA